MVRELKGSRSSREASVVLSSVDVEARRLDSAGAPVGDAITLGSLTIDTSSGLVSLDGTTADGWQILLRERGRDSQTTAVKVFFAPEVVEPTPDPEPEPTPDPQPEPEPEPTGWPDASNTGAVGPLTQRSGLTIRTAGAVFQNQHFTGTVVVDAPNVTISNCRVDAEFFGIEATSRADGLIVDHCTIIGGGDCGIASTQSDNISIRRNNVSGGSDGMKIAGTNVVVEDNYIHDLDGGPTSHNDGIQCYGNATNLVIRRNSIYSRDTSCIAMFEGQHTWRDVLVEGNYLTDAGYLLYAAGTSGTNVRVIGNMFGNYGYSHPVTDWAPKTGHEWSGNVYTDGRPVPQP